MAKVKFHSENMSGKGARVSIDDYKIPHVAKFEFVAGVGQAQRAKIEAFADGLELEANAHVDLTVTHRISDLTETRVRYELADLFERRIGHGDALFTIDEVIEALNRASSGKLKP